MIGPATILVRGEPCAVPALACEGCGSRKLIAVSPGSEPETASGGILIARGEAARGWCWACWPMLRSPL